ncbi:MAG: SGNH/GDSL hydrolase family protein, partial [Planctomycetota bacterium]
MIAAILAVLLFPRQSYPPVPPAADSPAVGANIQRTMTLLATSTPQKRNKVRILFYGQSITEQNWWKLVAEDLRRRFPNADLEIENKAVGGFASQILVRLAEHDIPAFYPDLVIFHVYGANNTYEEILRTIRTRTTAEVLIQKDHVGAQWPVENPDQKNPMWWDHMMNNVFLPDYAKKYRCGLADVRTGWVGYLKANGLQPKALLSDDIHLNDHGCFVMSELVKRYLVHKPELLTDDARGSVRTLEVGKDVQREGQSLKLPFEGNRVDLLAAKGAGGTAKILIDGKKPSEFAECVAFTRTSPSQSWWGPALLRVSSEKPREI